LEAVQARHIAGAAQPEAKLIARCVFVFCDGVDVLFQAFSVENELRLRRLEIMDSRAACCWLGEKHR
jgi:hypothetical protein